MSDTYTVKARPVVFGEVLVSNSPSQGPSVGGGPFNVAWHLQGFGLDPLLISRIGADAQGESVLELMRTWGMDTSAVQSDRERPTGRPVGEGVDSTTFSEQAHEHTDVTVAARALRGRTWSLLYYGGLAVHSLVNRAVAETLHNASRAPVFLDVHMRGPWWESTPVGELLSMARWAKLNRADLHELSGAVMDDTPSLMVGGADLRHRHELDLLLVTGTKTGAHFFTPTESGCEGALADESYAYSEGVEDAFTAVCILGILMGWSVPTTVARAAVFVANIGSLPCGASIRRELYAALRAQWEF